MARLLGMGMLGLLVHGCGPPQGESGEGSDVSARSGRARSTLAGDWAQRVDALLAAREQKLVAGDSAEVDQFGYSVAVTADRALVGAYGESRYRGAGYVFVRTGDGWTPEQKLVASDGVEGDSFGWSVSLAGDRALLGAHARDTARGAAYVLARRGGEWREDQTLVADDGDEYDAFGWSVALAGERALVGAYRADEANGTAYVFVAGEGGWDQEQRLAVSNEAVGGQFGFAVALDGDRALIGAPAEEDGRGAAYVFIRSDGSWVLDQRLEPSDGSANDYFGTAVSISGDLALVGAYWHDSFRGAAYVYARGEDGWTQEQRLERTGGQSGERFGGSVALAADRALIGAYGTAYARGAAHLFARGDAGWTPERTLLAADGADNDTFGWSVALGGGNALVGAHYDDALRGAAYLFELGLANGEPCALSGDCSSGHCVDGLCCNIDCDGACSACAVEHGAAVDGTCTVFPAGSGGDPPCSPLACTGFGQECAPCASGADCVEGRHCAADGMCQSGSAGGAGCDAGECGADETDSGRRPESDAGVTVTPDAAPPPKQELGGERAAMPGKTPPRSGCACHVRRRRRGEGWWLVPPSLSFLARRRKIRRVSAWFGLLLLAFGCGSDRMGADAGASAPPRSAVDREPAATSSESADGGDAGGAPEPVSDGPMDCAGSAVTTPKRVVRLTEHQLWNAYADLFGAAAAATITANEEAPSPDDRQFPPIGGDVGVSESLFALSDRLAQAAMRYVFENAATFSNCGAPPSDAACVKQELLSFAERAFRHPLDADEQGAITGQFWDEMDRAGASLDQALAYGVYGILISPGFLYRTELGAGASEAGRLASYELASTLSWFLLDRPPDAELLSRAAADELRTPDQVRAAATRLLDTPAARRNLERALFHYFALSRVAGVVLNADAVPGLAVNRGLLSSIHHEGELFLQHQLWTGTVAELLTSRETWTNAKVATEIYGVAAPTEVDADGFGRVELPSDRAGLLTLAPFLTASARPTGSSAVARGLAINGSIICQVNPPFPASVDPGTGEVAADRSVATAIAALASKSELEQAEYRAATAECAVCHSQFDAFGMVLEPYDAVGRLRSVDLEGRPIDESWTTVTLPASVGGGTVKSAVETARAVIDGGALDRCLAVNFIDYALTEVTRGGASTSGARGTTSCAVQAVLEAFEQTDGSFASLIAEIAASETLAVRGAGEPE